MSCNNNVSVLNNLSNTFTAADLIYSALIDRTSGLPLGTTATTTYGIAGSAFGIAEQYLIWEQSDKTHNDLERLAVGLASNTPGVIGFFFLPKKVFDDNFDNGENEAKNLAMLLKLSSTLSRMMGFPGNPIALPATQNYCAGKRYSPPRDPLLLDLDGDGLETLGLSAHIHFDHNGDGVLTGTGWVGGGDALLVWDRNANGRIDTGAELFGDFTPLPNGTLAPNGFAALAALDANGDGVIDASDPAFAQLRLWRDASPEGGAPDGLTGEGELISLAEAGIVALDLAHTLRNQGLANGNTLSREGSFTRADGTVSGMGEFRLALDTFDTEFADAITVPEALQALPNMGGSGNVRDLQQAAALSGDLAGVLAAFQGATTRGAQQALLDALLTAWAGTSGMDSLEERAEGRFRILYEAFGGVRRSSHVASATHTASEVALGAGLLTDAGNSSLSEEYRALIAAWRQKLAVLEAFNGQYFFNLPGVRSETAGANWGLAVQAGSGGSGAAALAIGGWPTLRVQFAQTQLDLLQQAYDGLRESVYASLVLQTRLRPYLDRIELVIDETGLRLDAAGIDRGWMAKQRRRSGGPANDARRMAA